MALESADYISQLVDSNPSGLDDKTTADDQARLIKHVMLMSFPLISGPVLVSQGQLNALSNLTVSSDVGSLLQDVSDDIVGLNARIDSVVNDLNTSNSTLNAAQGQQATNADNINTLIAAGANVISNLSNVDSRLQTLSANLATSLPQGTIYGGRIDKSGTAVSLPSGWTSTRVSSGTYYVGHSLGLGTSSFSIVTTPFEPSATGIYSLVFDINTDYFYIASRLISDVTFKDVANSFILIHI